MLFLFQGIYLKIFKNASVSYSVTSDFYSVLLKSLTSAAVGLLIFALVHVYDSAPYINMGMC
jgi:hypothetical protein